MATPRSAARAKIAKTLHSTDKIPVAKKAAAARKSPTPNASARARTRASANARFKRTGSLVKGRKASSTNTAASRRAAYKRFGH